MRNLFYTAFLIAGIGFASVSLTSAQENKAKAACCNKGKVTATTVNSSDCPMKANTAALTDAKVDCPKSCAKAGTKDCPKTGNKVCPKAADCCMKTGAVAGNKDNKSPNAKTCCLAEAK